MVSLACGVTCCRAPWLPLVLTIIFSASFHIKASKGWTSWTFYILLCSYYVLFLINCSSANCIQVLLTPNNFITIHNEKNRWDLFKISVIAPWHKWDSVEGKWNILNLLVLDILLRKRDKSLKVPPSVVTMSQTELRSVLLIVWPMHFTFILRQVYNCLIWFCFNFSCAMKEQKSTLCTNKGA